MKHASALCLTAMLLCGNTSFAQRGDSDGLPRIDSLLPDVSAYDDQGREFSLAELRGEYSVLVFGCLT